LSTSRRDLVYFILGGFFLTNALLGELTGGKLFAMPAAGLSWLGLKEVVLSIGVIPWPVVFISTDLINEYFGTAGVRRMTFLAVGMIGYAFLLLSCEILVPAWESSPVSHEVFARVFGQSMWIIVGSLTAFLTAQFLDVVIFHAVKRRTGHRMLWLRATGSTVFSQLVDTFVVLFIGFRLPSILKRPGYELTWEKFLQVAFGDYAYKLLIAILITPLIYLAHGVIDRFLEGERPEPRDSSRADVHGSGSPDPQWTKPDALR
jgi:uncharacterized integral membrane protein (TIGR00697 family)